MFHLIIFEILNSLFLLIIYYIFNYLLNSLNKYLILIFAYQTIITLCMRLALIDCLYPKEKPFVVFDDPFVNFDDEKLELCKNLMSDIANHYQIIYFTCHDSRVIK